MKNKQFALIISVIASILVIYKFLSFESLWLDEAFLVKNMKELPYSNLFGRLEFYSQVSSPIFLISSKFLLSGLKMPLEIGSRLVSLFSLFIGVYYVYRSLKIIGLESNTSILLSNILLVSSSLVRYACEAKQYELEFALSAILVFLSLRLVYQQINHYEISMFCLFYGFSFFAANTSVILLPYIFIIFMIVFRRNRYSLFSLKSLNFVIVLVFFVSWIKIQYLPNALSSTEDVMTNFWKKHDAFIEFKSTILASLSEFKHKSSVILSTFSRGITMQLIWYSLIFYFIFISIRIKRKNSLIVLVLFVPILTYLGMAYLHLYPIQDRLALFLLPYITLIIGFLLLDLRDLRIEFRFPFNFEWFKKYLIKTIVLFIIATTWWKTFRNNKYFGHNEHIRPALAYIEDSIAKSEDLFIYKGAYPAFDVYSKRFSSIWNDPMSGRRLLKYSNESLQSIKLNLGRSWFLMSHYRPSDKLFLVNFCTSKGVEISKCIERDGYCIIQINNTSLNTPSF